MAKKLFLPLFLALVGLTFPLGSSLVATPFTMQIVDEQTGVGVPDLRVTSDNSIVCFTQANGAVAWRESSIMGRAVRFRIQDKSNRYDGADATIQMAPGGQATLKVHRRT